jgi:cytochrome oxidase Cu insertion factor (SCO1/SenC/PrrC family)
MRKKISHFRATLILLISLFLSACNTANTIPPTEVSRPDWFNVSLTDVRSGESFTINDFDGKVVLLETMAMWCPNCIFQGNEIKKLHELLGNPEDLVSVSLDVDRHEEEAALKEYTQEFGFEWYFAVSPLEVTRALGNLYTAQYLNPPLSPMMIIDREGNVHHLDYGLKEAEALKEKVEPYLTP